MKNIIATLTILTLFFIMDAFSQSAGDYRSLAAGNWGTAATW